MEAVLEGKVNVFFGAAAAAPKNSFLAIAAQQGKPFTKDSCQIYVQRKENLPNLAH
ncbi:MAG: hypothetical protein MJZ91_02930 [Bacteroidales bacterium]|nr:hypothetical protein [Bacteroidales bacterium]